MGARFIASAPAWLRDARLPAAVPHAPRTVASVQDADLAVTLYTEAKGAGVQGSTHPSTKGLRPRRPIYLNARWPAKPAVRADGALTPIRWEKCNDSAIIRCKKCKGCKIFGRKSVMALVFFVEKV